MMNRALAGGLLAATIFTGALVAPAAAVGVDDETDRAERIEAHHQLRSDRLREVLEQLVVDGTIDRSQLDAVIAAVEAHVEDRRAELEAARSERAAQREATLSAIAEIIGTDAETITTELRAGATLAEIAGDQVDAVIDLLVQEHTDRINEAVAEDRIDQARADEVLESLEDRVTAAVDGEGHDFAHHGRHDRFRPELPGGN